MATVKTLTDIQLRLVLETDETKNGKAVTKNWNLNKINPSATAEQLIAAAEALATLQTLTLSDIKTLETNVLSSSE